jgi:hypothetical protein
MAIAAARKVNTPQAVACGLPRRWACRKIRVASPAAIATAIRKLVNEAVANRAVIL